MTFRTHTLYIVRGLPGSGKSTVASQLAELHCEADQFFVTPSGEYVYDTSLAKYAHAWCMAAVAQAMHRYPGEDIVVANTFTRHEEYAPYVELAKERGYGVQIVECHGNWGSDHDVPEEVLQKMRDRWEPTPV